MSGGKGDSNTVSTVRFAPYIEAAHIEYLEQVQDRRAYALSGPPEGGYIYGDPYRSYTEMELEAAFFGSGFALSSFPSLYDMYGKFMAGLDVEVLFNEAFQDTINGPVVDNLIEAEADILADDLEQEQLPRFETGMRDINSVMSSSFVVGRAMLEVGRTKAISRFSADFRAKLLPLVTERWVRHLDWNRVTIDMYAQILKLYVSARMDIDNHTMEINAKSQLWPFTILEYERIAVGVLNGAQDMTSTVKGASRGQKAVGGAMMGAAVGTEIAPGPGTVIGALLGLAGGLL